MARAIADALEGEVDAVLVHKLGYPAQPEVAMGAVDEEGHVMLNELGSATPADAATVEERPTDVDAGVP